MRNLVVLFIHFIVTLARLLGPGSVRCGVASPQAATPDCQSLPATIAESVRVGPHPRRLDGALGASTSSAPVRNRTYLDVCKATRHMASLVATDTQGNSTAVFPLTRSAES